MDKKEKKILRQTSLYVPIPWMSDLKKIALQNEMPIYKVIWHAIYIAYGKELGWDEDLLYIDLSARSGEGEEQ